MDPVLSASYLHGGKKELLFVRHFVGQWRSKIIVWSCGVLGHFTLQVFFSALYIHNLVTEKNVKKLISTSPCRGMQRTHKKIYKSK